MCEKLYIAPGNSGTKSVGQNVDIGVSDFGSIKQFVLDNTIDMVVVGPEDPLVNGIYDFFKANSELNHICVIGPSKQGAQLEGSKEFSKKFMEKFSIPTASYNSFTKSNLEQGYKFLESLSPPYVLKADGLAAGKGVLIIDNLEQAKSELNFLFLFLPMATAIKFCLPPKTTNELEKATQV